MTARILVGDCRTLLASQEPSSVQTCVTSPPYFGLRDYGHAGQIGLEATPDAFVAELVAVFREVRRVLKDDGTLWLNLGDSYAAGGNGGGAVDCKQRTNIGSLIPPKKAPIGYKPKDLLGIPWEVARALRADGWFLRSEIIWHKPNAMPESVTDRPTKAHETVFLLSKSASYFYDAEAIAEAVTPSTVSRLAQPTLSTQQGSARVPGKTNGNMKAVGDGEARNARTVWSITTQGFKGAHFATMPPELAERCILAGSLRGDTVLDPFGGAGTTGLVADRLGRNAVLCELNPEYAEMARARIVGDAPLFAEAAS